MVYVFGLESFPFLPMEPALVGANCPKGRMNSPLQVRLAKFGEVIHHRILKS